VSEREPLMLNDLMLTEYQDFYEQENIPTLNMRNSKNAVTKITTSKKMITKTIFLPRLAS